ncbi:cell envelope biogenesis protein OmpA [Streptomyces sp. RKAG337]|uniref:cell envelope biogenesis protein OmpA n=1 Tax=Streptomyces sp. RKAG337 TaxID=2893404 RepID=UPI002033A54E|nr:cell envelope biogenesis protein OmpA [Streptomyces sp. RKAG337]MCM2430920.1 cell envelope biogenesis protein OmpA [Streptomyces sp. RKAG337]
MSALPTPIRCNSRPRVGGLVVPWISYEHGGHATFGTIDPVKAHRALAHRLCQVCGQRLEERFCLAVRPMDVRIGFAPEPALHPECLAYSKQQCPMLSGAAATYRTSSATAKHPAGRPCDDPGCSCPKIAPDEGHSARSGRPADDFDAWMIDIANYRLKKGPRQPNVLLGLDLAVPVLRIRPIRRNPRPDVAELLTLVRSLGL